MNKLTIIVLLAFVIVSISAEVDANSTRSKRDLSSDGDYNGYNYHIMRFVSIPQDHYDFTPTITSSIKGCIHYCIDTYPGVIACEYHRGNSMCACRKSFNSIVNPLPSSDSAFIFKY